MEKMIVYAVIAIGFIIFRVLTNSKKSQTKRVPQRKDIHNKKDSSDERQRQIFKQLGLEDLLDKDQAKRTEKPAAEQTMKQERAILKKAMEDGSRSHFAEEEIIRKMEEAKKRGAQFSHHTHDYVPDSEYVVPEEIEDQKRNREMASFEKKQARAYSKKRANPLLSDMKKTLRSRKELKKAMIFKELLEKRF